MNDNMHTHYKPKNFSDLVAFSFTKLLRLFADLFFKKRYGHRAVILETAKSLKKSQENAKRQWLDKNSIG